MLEATKRFCVFTFDGFLSDTGHRKVKEPKWVDGRPPHEAAADYWRCQEDDPPVAHNLDILRVMLITGHHCVITTRRPSWDGRKPRDVLDAWLDRHGLGSWTKQGLITYVYPTYAYPSGGLTLDQRLGALLISFTDNWKLTLAGILDPAMGTLIKHAFPQATIASYRPTDAEPRMLLGRSQAKQGKPVKRPAIDSRITAGPWIERDDHAFRAVLGADPSDVSQRLAMIEKSPRVRTAWSAKWSQFITRCQQLVVGRAVKGFKTKTHDCGVTPSCLASTTSWSIGPNLRSQLLPRPRQPLRQGLTAKEKSV